MPADESRLRPLMLLALDGDRIAYRRVLESLADLLRVRFRRQAGRGLMASDIEDLVQITLVAIHERRDSYDRERPLLPWVSGVARYKMLEHLRAQRRRPATLPLDEGETASLSAADSNCAKRDADRLLGQLPAAHEEAVRLMKIEGRTAQEASVATGASAGAIKVRVHRGMQMLRSLARGAC